MRPAEEHAVDIRTVFCNPRREAPGGGAVEHLDSAILQRFGVTLAVGAVLGPEFDHAASLQQRVHERHHGARASIAVRLRHVMVDHQDHAAATGAVARAHHMRRVGIVLRGKRFRPALAEPCLVGDLVGFHARAEIGAVGDPLEMYHHRTRLIEHGTAGGAQPEGEIGILAIGGGKGWIEATNGREIGAAHQQGSAGEVVGVAHVIIDRFVPVIEAAIIPAGGIVPDDAAGFLQAAIGVDQLGTGGSGIGAAAQQIDERIQPAGLHLGIVVQEQQELGLGLPGGPVAIEQEAEILRVLDQPQVRYLAQLRHGRIT